MAKSLTVCMDIQSAIAQRAGVGRYTKALVEHAGAVAGGHELALFFFDFKRKGIPFPIENAHFRTCTWCPGRIAQKAWKTIGFPPFNWLAGPADVYHFPNFVIPPLTHGRAVVTIHDVSFLRFPEAAEPKNLRYLNSQIRKTVARADMIITDSRFSAGEICERLPVPPEKVRVVHLGLTPNMRAPAAEQVDEMRQALRLTRPYLLFVGTLEPRKNIPFLVECFEHMTSFDGDLVIAGMRGWKYEPILERMRTSSRSGRIRYLEYVEERWLPALYTGADCFVFPSLHEGFGFPPLEAMQCGTPVLSSQAGSLPEVLGEAALFVEGYNAAEWAVQAERLLGDSTLRAHLQAAGHAQAQRYQWRTAARQTWDIYEAVST
jgi:glycosyltransferase involved in cell wall biosynthesis